MEKISRYIKKSEVNKIRKEVVRAFLRAKKDAKYEEVEDLRNEEYGADKYLNVLKLFAEDEDLKDEKYEEDEDLKVLKPFLGKTIDYGNLQKLLSGKTPSEQATALHNLIKSYDPSSEENHKALLSQLFANLLQYVNDLFSNLKDEEELRKSFLIMDSIAPYFYDIALIDRVSSRKSFAELLTEKHNEYQKKPDQIPDLDTLIFFKLVSLLYPTSHFPHPVTSPCLTFMSEILTTCRFENARSISRGLFVCTLILEYTLLSKRYVPAAVKFLRDVLFLSAKTTIVNPTKPVPPFDLHKDVKILILEDDCSKLEAGMKMSRKDLLTDSIDNGFKIRTLLTTVLLLEEFFDNCNEMGAEAQECIFDAHIQLLSSSELELYPERVTSTVERIIKYMKGT